MTDALAKKIREAKIKAMKDPRVKVVLRLDVVEIAELDSFVSLWRSK
jgi:hypothetical protein